MTRFSLMVRMNYRQYVRRRLNVLLLLIVPALFVTAAFYAFRDQPTQVELSENGVLLTLVTTRRSYSGVFQALEAGCLLAGLAGVFMLLHAIPADRRLMLCGYRRVEVVGARIVQIALVAFVASTVISVATALHFWSGQARHVASAPAETGAAALVAALSSPAAPTGGEVNAVVITVRRSVQLLVAVWLASIIYSAIGIAIAGAIGRALEGSFVLFALSLLDVIVVNTRIVSGVVETWWARFTPAYHPARLLEAAAFGEHFPLTHVVWSLLVFLAASALAVVTFHRLGRE